MAKGWSFGGLIAALKSAAFKDVGTSPGQVITVGDLQGIGAPYNKSAMETKNGGSFGYEVGRPSSLYPNQSVVHVGMSGPTSQEWGQIAISYGTSLRAWLANKDYDNPTVRTAEIYHTLNKPSAQDVGALPTNGGGLVSGNVTVSGAVTVGQQLTTQGQINSLGTLSVGGTANLQAETTIRGQLNQFGVSNFGKLATFYSNIICKSTFDIDGYVSAGGGIYDGIGASARRVWSMNNQNFEYSLPGNGAGWVRDKQSGLIIQWGRVDLNDNAVINLHIPFPSNSWAITISCDGGQVPTAPEISQAYPINSSQWVGAAAYWTGNSWKPASGLRCTWIAIGN